MNRGNWSRTNTEIVNSRRQYFIPVICRVLLQSTNVEYVHMANSSLCASTPHYRVSRQMQKTATGSAKDKKEKKEKEQTDRNNWLQRKTDPPKFLILLLFSFWILHFPLFVPHIFSKAHFSHLDFPTFQKPVSPHDHAALHKPRDLQIWQQSRHNPSHLKTRKCLENVKKMSRKCHLVLASEEKQEVIREMCHQIGSTLYNRS